jgi:hypothetical protein
METLIGQEPETKFDVTKISLKCHENLTKLTQTSLQYQLMQMLLKSLEIFRTFLLQDQKLLCKMSLFGTNGKNGDRIGSCWVAKRNCIFSRFPNITIKLKKYILIS